LTNKFNYANIKVFFNNKIKTKGYEKAHEFPRSCPDSNDCYDFPILRYTVWWIRSKIGILPSCLLQQISLLQRSHELPEHADQIQQAMVCAEVKILARQNEQAPLKIQKGFFLENFIFTVW